MTQPNILIVDDDPMAIKFMGVILCDQAKIRVATNGKEALRMVRDALPDLILLAAKLPDMTGFQLCDSLKSDPALAGTPVIFVTSHCEEAFEAAGLEMGAVDFIGKPFSASTVLARVRTQLRAKVTMDSLRRIAALDPETGVANKRQFDGKLERERLRARREGDPLR